MKLINKKTTNYTVAKKTNPIAPNVTTSPKKLGIFQNFTRSSDHLTGQFEYYQFAKSQNSEIEAELKRNQGRTYASLTPLR